VVLAHRVLAGVEAGGVLVERGQDVVGAPDAPVEHVELVRDRELLRQVLGGHVVAIGDADVRRLRGCRVARHRGADRAVAHPVPPVPADLGRADVGGQVVGDDAAAGVHEAADRRAVGRRPQRSGGAGPAVVAAGVEEEQRVVLLEVLGREHARVLVRVLALVRGGAVAVAVLPVALDPGGGEGVADRPDAGVDRFGVPVRHGAAVDQHLRRLLLRRRLGRERAGAGADQ
jgi:hypothetical protein